ncbi:exported protein of unknown function [Nitrospira moscoviensis]|uniref:Lipoprotein n=1 Tax=Nitrospira moscoviensis TaxID=42253 RepID=A0A0K2GAQ7_NITMO|nr:exported protein of unknown function [Nitrospira moscoviensis]
MRRRICGAFTVSLGICLCLTSCVWPNVVAPGSKLCPVGREDVVVVPFSSFGDKGDQGARLYFKESRYVRHTDEVVYIGKEINPFSKQDFKPGTVKLANIGYLPTPSQAYADRGLIAGSYLEPCSPQWFDDSKIPSYVKERR